MELIKNAHALYRDNGPLIGSRREAWWQQEYKRHTGVFLCVCDGKNDFS